MIIFIGTFPPPVHGMATINQAVFERLMEEGWLVEKFNSSPRSLKNDIFSRTLSRIKLFISIWSNLLQRNLSKGIVYLSLSGGKGQIYDVITVLLARLKGAKCMMHHHSVAYLERKNMLSALLFQLAGRDAGHIVLCEHMKGKLQKTYGSKLVSILSNLALLRSDRQGEKEVRLQTIGFLSNITKEKGGWEVIRLAEVIREKGWLIKCKVAGPCEDRELLQSLQKAHEGGLLEWTGPLYDRQKIEFWNSIDLFVFPTKYKNEAEPLVVWETLLLEIPVIAYDRGCISTQVGSAGKIIPNDCEFVAAVMEQLELWQKNPRLYQNCVQDAAKIKEVSKENAEKQWKEFLLMLHG